MSAEVHLILGDALDVLREIENDSATLFCTDPPYAVSAGKKNIDRSKWTSKAARQRVLVRDFGEWDHFTPESYAVFMTTWLAEAYRILNPGGQAFVFGVLEDMGRLKEWAEGVGFKWVQQVLWLKRNPAPQFVGARQFAYAAEGIGFLRKNGSTPIWNGNNTTPNWILTSLCQGNERTGHPTQKSTAIIRPLIEVASTPGDLVIDPFLGSGTCAVVCKSLGRRVIGIERHEPYFRLAQVRCGLRVPDDKDLRLLRGNHSTPEESPLPLFDGIC